MTRAELITALVALQATTEPAPTGMQPHWQDPLSEGDDRFLAEREERMDAENADAQQAWADRGVS